MSAQGGPVVTTLDATAKPCRRSWTLWINLAAAALVALQAGMDLLEQVLSARLYLGVALVLPMVNAVLRVLTTQALVLPLVVQRASARVNAWRGEGEGYPFAASGESDADA
ncbi:MAG: hypothetical protein U0973_11555 [Xanthomonadaceae bacterium]|nr:hypothetical protein [Xanthomonadaceae bacterium]